MAAYMRVMWPVLEPTTPLVWNWHLDLLCDALQQQALGRPEYRKLLLVVPPGLAKSITTNVVAPSWEWLDHPSRRKLFLSNDYKLCTRDSRRMREVLKSPQYRALLNYCAHVRGVDPWHLAADQNEKVNYENSARGSRQCLSIDSTVTGKRADDVVIDDPIDAKEVETGSIEQVRERLEKANTIIDKVLPSRVNDLATARWTIIMQRLAEDDPAGRAMAEGGWHVVNLQMEYEPKHPRNHLKDPRRVKGDLLFPAKFPETELAKLRTKLGSRSYSAQYQGEPLPSDGGPLKRWDWRFWYPADTTPPPPERTRKPDGTQHEHKQVELPADLLAYTQSWDLAFKDTKDSAFVVGQVWAQNQADSFLLDQVRDKLDINGSLDAVRALSKRWPAALVKLVEDKANGPAVIGMLQRELPGLTEVQPEGGKEARANACAPAIRSGNVYLPHPALFPWVRAFLDETESFPGGAYADQVDAATQYLIRRYCVPQPAYGYTPAPRQGSVAHVRRSQGGLL